MHQNRPLRTFDRNISVWGLLSPQESISSIPGRFGAFMYINKPLGDAVLAAAGLVPHLKRI
jgi:hypothetical protein